MAAAIQVEGLSKKYCRSLRRSALYGFADVLRGAAGRPTHAGELRRDEFWALREVELELHPGEALGVIGHNGAGKSTLLKVLSGIIEPDRGRVRMRGRVAALIQLGAGFHPQLTGRENAYVNAQILGMRRSEIDAKLDRVVEFSGVGDFLDTPVKYYSSGMFVRLGFAVAAHLDPDVLLVDEVLAVGDMAFQARCMMLMAELRDRGTTLVFVSHNEELVRRACDRALLLDHGRCAAQGDVNEVYAAYHRAGGSLAVARAGNGVAEIDKLEILDAGGRRTDTVRLNEPMTLRMHVVPHQPLENPVLDLGFNSNHGYTAASANNQDGGFELGPRTEPFWVELRFGALRLAPGGYRITAQIMASDRLEIYDWRRNGWPLYVEADRYVRGTTYLPVSWSVASERHAADAERAVG